jgi:class 3 adenylate cyclase
MLDAHDELAQRQLARYRGRLVRTMGDGLLATFDGPARAIRSAMAIRDGLRRMGMEIRGGLHTGEIEGRVRTWAGSPSILPLEYRPWLNRVRCWHRER